MSRIITKNRDPKVNEFGPNDLVLNTITGDLFLKSKNQLFSILGRNVLTKETTDSLLKLLSEASEVAEEGGQSATLQGFDLGDDGFYRIRTSKPLTGSNVSLHGGTPFNYGQPLPNSPYIKTNGGFDILMDNADTYTNSSFRVFKDTGLAGVSPGVELLSIGDEGLFKIKSQDPRIQHSTIAASTNIGNTSSSISYAVYTGMGDNEHIKIADGAEVRIDESSRLSIQPPQPSIRADVGNNIINFKDLNKGEIDVSSYEIKNPILISSNINIPTNQIAVLENGTNKTIKIANNSSIRVNTDAQLFANFIKNIPSIDTNTKTTITSNIISTGVIEGKLDGGSF